MWCSEHCAPEFIKSGAVSNKYDIFSLGVVIIKIMVGHKGYSLLSEMGPNKFSEHVRKKVKHLEVISGLVWKIRHQHIMIYIFWFLKVCNKWRRRLQAIPGYTTLDTDCQQVKICVEIALRCILEDTNKRPPIMEIMERLNQTEEHINDSAVWIEEVCWWIEID